MQHDTEDDTTWTQRGACLSEERHRFLHVLEDGRKDDGVPSFPKGCCRLGGRDFHRNIKLVLRDAREGLRHPDPPDNPAAIGSPTWQLALPAGSKSSCWESDTGSQRR